MNIEEELHATLARVPAPAGFAGRVLHRVAERRKVRIIRTWMAMAAMLALACLITVQLRVEHVRRLDEGRRAGQQVTLALKIARAKLHTTRNLLRRTTHAI